jgi:AcrR family transcriptional regulator
MADGVVNPPRRYDSSRRQEQARATRLHVLRTAVALFVEQGYARTTIAEVARTAGVSAETIYATFKNKATLLHKAWDITVGGDDQDVVFHERPEIRALAAEPDLAKRLRMQAVISTTTARRTAPFQLMLLAAAGAEPSAAELLEEIGRQRLAGISVMARFAAATGQLAVSEEEARDFVWATTDGMLWHRLAVERGWSDDQYAQWLGDVWVGALVRKPGSRTSRPGKATRP